MTASSAMPAAICPKPQANTSRALTAPQGIGRSGRSRASIAASNKDTALVKGSHGRLTDDPQHGPLVISSGAEAA